MALAGPRHAQTALANTYLQVFMTRRDSLECFHEPFGDPFYFGPERLSERYENDELSRVKSGYSKTTYKDVMDQLVDDTREVRPPLTPHL